MFITDFQSVVARCLSVTAFQNKWKDYKKKGTGYYYAITYPPILSFFRAHPILSDALSLKVALVFSWNPTICRLTSIRFRQAKRELATLEPTRKELNTKDISSIDVNEVIRELWGPAKKATSSVDSDYGVSVTKFLHFSFPHIFPIIDAKTMNKLGRTHVNLESYSLFLSEWKNVYKHSRASFEEISNAVGLPVARVLDVMLFTPQQHD